MAENTYEYECSRAELLGISKPTYEEYLSKRTELEEVQDEALDTQNLEEVDIQNEGMKGVGGKLGELNQILQGTQKKLNRFKASYGSITNILKIKLGRNQDSTSAQSETEINRDDPSNHSEATSSNVDKDGEVTKSIDCDIDNKAKANNIEGSTNGTPIRKSDLSRALDNQVDSLDRLNEQAEQLETKMSQQTGLMKKFMSLGFPSMGGGK